MLNSTFSGNNDAIFADGGSQPIVAYNTFTDNVRPIYIYPYRIDGNLYGNSYSNNTKNYIEVAGGHLSDNRTYHWLKDGAPYVITDPINVYYSGDNDSRHSWLNIESGTELQFHGGKRLYIGHDTGSSGYWGGIQAEGDLYSI